MLPLEDIVVNTMSTMEGVTFEQFEELLRLTQDNYISNYLILVFITSLTICLIIYSVLKKFI